MPTQRFDIPDISLDRWGRLVKSWATGLDYISQEYEDHPPRTVPLPPIKPDNYVLPPLGQVDVPGTSGGTVPLKALSMRVLDFKAKLTAAGVNPNIPSQYTNVIIVQGDVNSMVVRLPPKDILQDSEDDLIDRTNPYRIRRFYVNLFGGVPPTLPADKAGIMKLHANRIGEYTMANCD